MCFTGECRIRMANGGYKYVMELQPDERVWGGHRIVTIVTTPVHKDVDMITFHQGLKITPWHPMKLRPDLVWVFPVNVGIKKRMYVDLYYNLVLDSGHIVELNDFPVVTLGHELGDNEVVTHPYYGTYLVVEDLKKHPKWKSGFIVLDSESKIIRSEKGLLEGVK